MKRTFLIATTMLLTATTAFANENGDTLIVNNPTQVSIINNDSTCVISIHGKNNSPEYSFRQIIPLGNDNAVIINETSTEWNFKMPTFKPQKEKWNKEKSSIDVSLGLFGMGYVNSLHTPHNMKTELMESYEFLGPRLMFMLHPKMSRWAYGIGIGTNWKNFRMDREVRFDREPNGNTILTEYPEGANIGFSRVKVFSWTMPLELKYYASEKLTISALGIVNFNTHASLKTRFTTTEGYSVKDLDTNLHQTPVTMDFMLHAEFGFLGIYAKYSPCNVFENGCGPKFQAISGGITFAW